MVKYPEEVAPQGAQYSVIVHQRECPCGEGNNRFAEFKGGCRVDVYPATPPEAGGFGPAVGYIQPPPEVSAVWDELCMCIVPCSSCPYDEPVDRSITD